MQTSKYLLGTASVLALLASSAATPANAQATNGIYFGGSTLASEAFRQLFNCYTGATIGVTPTYTDGYTFSPSFNANTPTPGLIPDTCGTDSSVAGLYAGAGSGNGFRGYLSNNPQQWFGGTVTPGGSAMAINTPLPATRPPLIDYANPQGATFGSFPYPRVDVGMSDSPLPGTLASLTTVSFSFSPTQSWTTTGGALAQVTLNPTTAAVAYNTTAWGNPVQLPAFEVPVAIPVNVSAFTPNSQIKSGGNIVTGGAIQLSGAQLCAIFSGLVTDWNSTANIPTLNNVGGQVNQPFYYTNVGNGIGTATPYASSSLPIKLVYRSDGSGTSFIMTNYLKAVCPLLDPGNSFGYQTIFNQSNLPNTAFANLITNITTFRGAGPWSSTTTVTTTAWIGANGSGGVQDAVAAVGVTTTQSARIGYVSGDFVKPYALATTAPHAASVQDEAQRIANVLVPATATTTSPTFIPPTPTAVNLAWSDSALVPPATTSTWAAWNVYGINFAATEPAHGGVAVAGRSVLPLTNRAGAYPLSGTAYLALYSCYGNDTNGQNLINFLNWLYLNTGDPNVPDIMKNNSFSVLNNAWLSRIQNGYLSPGSGVAIALASGGSVDGCTGVSGGANP